MLNGRTLWIQNQVILWGRILFQLGTWKAWKNQSLIVPCEKHSKQRENGSCAAPEAFQEGRRDWGSWSEQEESKRVHTFRKSLRGPRPEASAEELVIYWKYNHMMFTNCCTLASIFKISVFIREIEMQTEKKQKGKGSSLYWLILQIQTSIT